MKVLTEEGKQRAFEGSDFLKGVKELTKEVAYFLNTLTQYHIRGEQFLHLWCLRTLRDL